MNIWHDADDKRIQPDDFLAVIEIPKNSHKKYELDKETGLLILDRMLSTSTHYPENYGFIPKTLAGDNDPLDVLVICENELNPLSLVRCKPIGLIEMTDNYEKDEKVIAVPINDYIFGKYNDISEMPEYHFDRIRHFFEVYKYLENKNTKVENIKSAEYSKEIIKELKVNYQNYFKKRC